jgi:hypothetical protein
MRNEGHHRWDTTCNRAKQAKPGLTGLTGLNRKLPFKGLAQKEETSARRGARMHGCVQDRCRVPLITDKRLDKLARAPEVA